MQYEEIEDGKLPQAVEETMMALIQMDPNSLINEVLTWNPFYGEWATICRKRNQSSRLSYINESIFLELESEYSGSLDESVGTLMTVLWCFWITSSESTTLSKTDLHNRPTDNQSVLTRKACLILVSGGFSFTRLES